MSLRFHPYLDNDDPNTLRRRYRYDHLFIKDIVVLDVFHECCPHEIKFLLQFHRALNHSLIQKDTLFLSLSQHNTHSGFVFCCASVFSRKCVMPHMPKVLCKVNSVVHCTLQANTQGSILWHFEGKEKLFRESCLLK